MLASLFLINSDLAGVKTEYTPYVLKEAMREKAVILKEAPDSVAIECISHPKNDLYIGVKQQMKIRASLANVDQVLVDIDHYQDLFPGYKDVHVISKEENKWLTYWEQKVPLFFVPNVKYELIYLTDRSRPNVVTYLYQLKKPGTLKASDGFVQISRIDEQNTLYTEEDFFDAEWGAAKVLGKSKIWNDAVTGIFHSDFATKLKAEILQARTKDAKDPLPENKDIRDDSEKRVDAKAIEACLAKKVSVL